MKFLYKSIKYFFSALLPALSLAMVSCDDHFFEYEGDCDVHHVVKFVYDMNLKWANAFPQEVSSVNLYAFDEKGIFVKEYTGAGQELKNPGYQIELDLPTGKYQFLAWCGLKNEGTDKESFTVPTPVAGVTTIEDMSASLNTTTVSIYGSRADGDVYSNSRLNFFYWGYIPTLTLPDNHDGTTYEYTVYLTKDTNHIRIILQELSGGNMEPGDYKISLRDANGLLAWNNNPIGNKMIDYQPWSQVNDEVGVGKVDVSDGKLTYVKGLVADMSTSRLMSSMANGVMLQITNADTGELIINVPFIQYALLGKEYYEDAYGHRMTDQEFLDREDEHVMTFFLLNGKWMNAYIDIQQWRVVLHDYEVGGRNS